MTCQTANLHRCLDIYTQLELQFTRRQSDHGYTMTESRERSNGQQFCPGKIATGSSMRKSQTSWRPATADGSRTGWATARLPSTGADAPGRRLRPPTGSPGSRAAGRRSRSPLPPTRPRRRPCAPGSTSCRLTACAACATSCFQANTGRVNRRPAWCRS
jgi:hypothetical protein